MTKRFRNDQKVYAGWSFMANGAVKYAVGRYYWGRNEHGSNEEGVWMDIGEGQKLYIGCKEIYSMKEAKELGYVK